MSEHRLYARRIVDGPTQRVALPPPIIREARIGDRVAVEQTVGETRVRRGVITALPHLRTNRCTVRFS